MFGWLNGNGKRMKRVKDDYELRRKNYEARKAIPLKDLNKYDDRYDNDYEDYIQNGHLKERVKELETELQLLRTRAAENVLFLQEMIIKLIDQPKNVSGLAGRYANTLSPKELNRGITKPDFSDPKAGPAGKLP